MRETQSLFPHPDAGGYLSVVKFEVRRKESTKADVTQVLPACCFQVSIASHQLKIVEACWLLYTPPPTATMGSE